MVVKLPEVFTVFLKSCLMEFNLSDVKIKLTCALNAVYIFGISKQFIHELS